MTAGVLRRRVAFDAPDGQPDGFGGVTRGWAEHHVCRAEVRYDGGSEAIEAGRNAGRAIFRVRVRSSSASRQIRSDWRMRDLDDGGRTYGVAAPPDVITDPAWVWLRVEGEATA